MTSLTDIVEKIDLHRSEIRGFGVRRLGVFGSFVRGDSSEESDVDILVELENQTFRAYMGLCFLLEDVLGREVDVVIESSLRGRAKDRILSEVKYVEGF